MTPLTDIAGKVHLALRWRAGRAVDVDLRAERPRAADTMHGRSADEAVRLLPLLYSICGKAQGRAVALAVAAARGAAAAPAVDPAVLAEARREHLWRLLLDWTSLLGLPREKALLAEAVRRLAAGDFEDWREGGLRAALGRLDAALAAVADRAVPTRLLPALTAEQTLAAWPRLDAACAAAPTYAGRPTVTGALARREPALAETSWPAHVRARIAELFEESPLGRTSAVPVAEGIGRAVVETARGMLTHEVVVVGGRVEAYFIVAPTEWNFHARGALPAALAGLATGSADELRAAAERLVLAFDPCVRCDIDVA